MRAFALVAALLAAGCLGTPDATTATVATPSPLPAPVDVYNATIDFALGASGSVRLQIPAGARALTLSVSWLSESPATATTGPKIEIIDKHDDVTARCEHARGVSQSDDQDCFQTGSVNDAPYDIVWDGRGAVKARVVVTVD